MIQFEIITREDAQRWGLKTFFHGRPCRRGHLSNRLTKGQSCVECSQKKYLDNVQKQEWKARNRQTRLKNVEGGNRSSLESYKRTRKTKSGWLRLAIKRAKIRAKKMGWDFDIKVADVEFPDYCPYLDVKLVIGEGGPAVKDNNASLDRIDSSMGYVKGNVEVISILANRIKSNAKPEDIMKVAVRLVERHGA